MPSPWNHLASRPLADYRIFKVRADTCENPATGQRGEFFILESVHWVNVIALTPDDRLVMVEQYRFGSRTVELEVPGGMMDRHETDPVATAVRELREETGYAGENARLLGSVFSNPAIMNNTTFTVIIENCRLQHDTAFDHHEDLETKLVPVGEIPGLIRAGRIKHPLVIVALYHLDLLRRQR
jgi:8-oxo-dGTP pyrophosphatase MutT (NUDIX family)